MKVETSTGFKCDVDENVLKQYRFVKLVTMIEKDASAIFGMISMLLGENEERLMDHLYNTLGHYPEIEEVANEVNDILNKLKDNSEDIKKS